jgi:hypothetical protein
MSSYRVDEKARQDPRFKILGKLLGSSRFDALARMGELWAYCADQESYFLSETLINTLTECENFSQMILNPEVGLAELSEKGIRIKGTKGRIEWLSKLRKNGKKGGRPKKTKPKPEGYPEANQDQTKTEPPSNPLTLTPALAPALVQNTELRTKGQNAETLPAKAGTGSLPGVKKPRFSDEAREKARKFAGAYVKAYQTRFPGGRPEDLNDEITRGQIQNWIKNYPLDRAVQLIQVYFQLEGKWFGTKGYDFITFRSNLNKIGQALDSGKDPDGNTVDWASVYGGAS